VAFSIRDQTAIVGIGQSEFGRFLPDSQLKLGAKALKAALEDAGLTRADVDGVAIHLGWPLGVDYDRVAEAYGLSLRWVSQTWLHGRFVTSAIQHAAMAVACGLANVVACVTAISFTRERQILGGPGDAEGTREDGGTHGEGGHAFGRRRMRPVIRPASMSVCASPASSSASERVTTALTWPRFISASTSSSWLREVLVTESID